MPLEYAHVQKSGSTVFDHSAPIEEKDTIRKDVRAPKIEMTFDLQKDVHANSADPDQQAIVDQSFQINFNKIQLQQFFEQLERVQLKLDELNS